MEETCTRENLRAIILVEQDWGVKDNGNADEADGGDTGGSDLDFVDYYKCDNCDQRFEPKSSNVGHMTQAWQAALDHLPKRTIPVSEIKNGQRVIVHHI